MNLRKVVIIGAGLIGYPTAYKFAQKGLDVTMIDDRLNESTRAGSLDNDTRDLLAATVDAKFETSSSQHLKEAQRHLHNKIAMCPNIKLIKGSFLKTLHNGVEYKNLTTHEICQEPADIIIDASGTKRAIVTDINRQEEKAPFTIESYSNPPIKNHFFAYILIENSDDRIKLKNFKTPLKTRTRLSREILRTKEHVTTMEMLRTNFGWPTFTVPDFRCFLLNKNKACIYLEAPPNLDPSQYNDYLRVALYLYTGSYINFKQLKPSKKFGDKKKRFMPFHLAPLVVTPAVYSSTKYPLIVLIGDALMNGDYRLGLGIPEGLKKLNSLLQAITFLENKIVKFDIAMHLNVLRALNYNTKQLHDNAYHQQQTLFEKDLLDQYQNYSQALISTTNTPFQSAIEASLQEIYILSCAPKYQKIKKEYERHLQNDSFKLDSRNQLINAQFLLIMREKLDEMVLALSTTSTLRADIIITLLNIANQYQKFAFHAFKKGAFKESSHFCLLALEILEKYNVPFHEGVIQCYVNTIKALGVSHQCDIGIKKAEKLLSILSNDECKIPNKDDLRQKAIYYKVLLTIQQLHSQLKSIPSEMAEIEIAKVRTILEAGEKEISVEKFKTIRHVFESCQVEVKPAPVSALTT